MCKMKPLKSRRETYSGRKGMICAVLLAATAENLACAMRIPVGDEGKKAASVLGVPDG